MRPTRKRTSVCSHHAKSHQAQKPPCPIATTPNDTHVSGNKRPPSLTTAVAPPAVKRRRREPTTVASDDDNGAGLELLSGAVTTLDDSKIMRPFAHLAPSDVSFLSGDRSHGFAVHSFMLRMRSAVFATMLPSDSCPADKENQLPIVLPEPAADLKLFFEALYSNYPLKLLSEGTKATTLARLSHKYAASELEVMCSSHLRRLAKTARFVGTCPSAAELLLVAQETQNDALQATILALPMKTLCSTGPTPTPTQCATHPGHPLPCYYNQPACTQLPPPLTLDSKQKAVLGKLSPKTLVALIEKLTLSLVKPAAPRLLY